MLTHHEPSTTSTDYASLSPEQRATFVQGVIRRAHAERAKAVADLVKGFLGRVTFRRAEGSARSTLPKHARHA